MFAFSWFGLTVIPNLQIGALNPQADEEGTDVYPQPPSGMAVRRHCPELRTALPMHPPRSLGLCVQHGSWLPSSRLWYSPWASGCQRL